MHGAHSAKKVSSPLYSYSFPQLPKELLRHRLRILRLVFSELRPHLPEIAGGNMHYISESRILLPVVERIRKEILPKDTVVESDQIWDMVIQLVRRYAVRVRCAVREE